MVICFPLQLSHMIFSGKDALLSQSKVFFNHISKKKISRWHNYVCVNQLKFDMLKINSNIVKHAELTQDVSSSQEEPS